MEWYRWAKNQTDLKPPEKAVLVCIADYYNDKEGCAWPSQETLAKDTSYNRATIHRACKSLRRKGLLSWEKIMLPSGQFSSNRYRLNRVADSHKAESVVAEQDTTMLQKVTLPCCTEQQKPLGEPLELTLSSSKISEKREALSEKQKRFAEMLANRYFKHFQREGYPFKICLNEVESFLVTDQSEDDWFSLGNGLPSPHSLGWV